MTERSRSSPLAVPWAVVRLAAGALLAEALAVLTGLVSEAAARAAGYAGRALLKNAKRAYAFDRRAFLAWCGTGGV